MNKQSGSRVGFPTLLAILFIGLKLTNHIDWSWWLVLAPVWIPFAVLLSIGAVAGIIALGLKVFAK